MTAAVDFIEYFCIGEWDKNVLDFSSWERISEPVLRALLLRKEQCHVIALLSLLDLPSLVYLSSLFLQVTKLKIIISENYQANSKKTARMTKATFVAWLGLAFKMSQWQDAQQHVLQTILTSKAKQLYFMDLWRTKQNVNSWIFLGTTTTPDSHQFRPGWGTLAWTANFPAWISVLLSHFTLIFFKNNHPNKNSGKLNWFKL